MIRRLPLVLALCATPLAASDLTTLSDAERDAFRAEVRTYLLENPEVLMEAIGILQQREEAAKAASDSDLLATHATAIFEDGHSYIGGNPDGDITLVEFMDYRCGYCRRAHPEVSELLGSDGNIRWIVKEFPILGEQSVLASRFAISVLRTEGEDAYGRTHDALMEMRGDVTDDSLRRIAGDLGLDADAVLAGMSDPEVIRIITENRALAQSLNINGTPSFIFETEFVRGYVPLDAMRGLVEDLRG